MKPLPRSSAIRGPAKRLGRALDLTAGSAHRGFACEPYPRSQLTQRDHRDSYRLGRIVNLKRRIAVDDDRRIEQRPTQERSQGSPTDSSSERSVARSVAKPSSTGVSARIARKVSRATSQSAFVRLSSGTETCDGTRAHGDRELRARLGITENLCDVVPQLSLRNRATILNCYTPSSSDGSSSTPAHSIGAGCPLGCPIERFLRVPESTVGPREPPR